MSDTLPTENLADVPMPEPEQVDRYAKGFKNLAGVPANVARAITQRCITLLKDRKEFEEYVMRARMQHLLVTDYHARNAPDPDDRKKAAETFLKLSDAFLVKKARR